MKKNGSIFVNRDRFFGLTVGDVRPIIERDGKRYLCICGNILPQYSGWDYKGLNSENKHVFSRMSQLGKTL